MNDISVRFPHLLPQNIELLRDREILAREIVDQPAGLVPLFRPCEVKVLVVADGLDFSLGGFGLQTFVRSLLDFTPFYVRFRITLAHLGAPGNLAMMGNDSRIMRRIENFKFDDPNHFSTIMYDQVWLFGIATVFNRGPSYPSDTLKNSELDALAKFMDAGGGLFATGDHGALGKPLCAEVPRARSMRIWDHTDIPESDTDEVSMGAKRRNDTNRLGRASENTDPSGSEFNDQSDDIPQDLIPKMYTRWSGIFSIKFPHPLLCGPNGIIKVFPDHPHEGECVVPTNTSANFDFGSGSKPEYPDSTSGGPRPIPEIIAQASVLAGTESGGKDPTQPHNFGAICAYDGHQADVGRVVTDSTWHHYVNINLIGESPTSPGSKSMGFLYSTSGQAHLENIRSYYRNVAVWMSRPQQIYCMSNHMFWWLLWDHRIIETVLDDPNRRLGSTRLIDLYLIGRHARDVIGRLAGQCQSWRIIYEVLQPAIKRQLSELLDIWHFPDAIRKRKGIDDMQWIDPSHVLDIAAGGAIVALREKFPQPDRKFVEQTEPTEISEVIREGALNALVRAQKSIDVSMRTFIQTMEIGDDK